jgi:pimeloyl-ACP methyl ester carboxylesterase
LEASFGVRLLLVSATFSSLVFGAAGGDRIVLKDGLMFSGTLDLKDERIEVTERHRVVSISRTMLLNPEEAVDVKPPIAFKMPQPVPLKPPRPLNPLAGYSKVEPFDEFGRRAVVVVSETGKTVGLIQAIHAIFPTHVETDVVEGSFRSTASLSTIPGAMLRKILRRCIDPKKEQERIRVVEFLLQAERFEEANQEIAELKRENFSAGAVETLTTKLARTIADLLLIRLERSAANGDVQRCREIAAEIRKQAGAEQLARLETVMSRLNKDAEEIAKAKRIIANAAMASASHVRAEDVNTAAKAVDSALVPSTLDRLRPLLFLAEKGNAKPEDLLAIAISGWCAGPELAQPDLERAADLWRARQLLLDAIEGDEIAFQDRLRRLLSAPLEGRPKLKPDLLAKMIAYLPGPLADRPIGAVSQVKTAGRQVSEIDYLVFLPPGYHPNRRWPALIALHDQNADPQKEISAWRGSASEFGFVVCCPVWRKDARTNWGFDVEDHVRLEEIVVDFRRRFAIDGDRLILAGRGTGGDVAWDFACGHPDDFAGLVSLSGLPVKYATRYTSNFAALPVLSLHGGLNMQRAGAMYVEFSKLCAKKCDAIHIVYPARGGESFASDVPFIFDWMNRRRRNAFPKKATVVGARETDRRFYWMEIENFREGALIPPQLFAKSRFTPATLDGTVTDAGTIVVRTNNLSSLELYLSPQLAPIDAAGFTVKVNNKTVLKGPVEPDLETMLRHLRKTGDFGRVVAKVVAVNRP